MENASKECPYSGVDGVGPYEHKDDVAAVCFSQCEQQISESTTRESEYDDYGVPHDPEGCMADLETSHQTLYFFAKGVRSFTTVQICEDHDAEVGEFIYSFECPYDTSVSKNGSQ